MKVCFPIEVNNGLLSAVYGHFGSAPAFLVLDSERREVTEVINRNRDHVHGQCSPVKALDGSEVDCVVVGGIGGGALNGLSRMNIKVYRSAGGTVLENLEKLLAGELSPLIESTCGGHGHSHGSPH